MDLFRPTYSGSDSSAYLSRKLSGDWWACLSDWNFAHPHGPPTKPNSDRIMFGVPQLGHDKQKIGSPIFEGTACQVANIFVSLVPYLTHVERRGYFDFGRH